MEAVVGRHLTGMGRFDNFSFPFTVFTWDQPDCEILVAGIIFRRTQLSVSVPITQEDQASISVLRWLLGLPSSSHPVGQVS